MKFLRPTKSPLVLVGVSIVIAAAVIWLFQRSGPAVKDIQHILLISIDTCRADYLSCYGYKRQTTPNIDKIAAEGTIFTNVISPIPITMPAHGCMLTGTIPPYHGAHDNNGYKLGKSNVTIGEILQPHTFTTAAIVRAFVLDTQFGLNQGFDYYNDHFEEAHETVFGNERRGEEASHFAIEWLEKHKNEKFFMFLHYYDPHTPYESPEPFASRFADNLYAGEIAYTDYCIGKVIQKLKQLKLYNSTLIIITGDHGEMLGEHGEIDHTYFIYQSAIRVPLIFKLPGQTKGRKVDDLVGLIDIVPTICGMLNIKAPPQVEGKDLSAYFGPKWPAATERDLYCESLTPTRYKANSLLGVVTKRFKYIQTTRPELYDLVEDPHETKNLVKDQPQRARILQDHLKQILEQTIRKDSADSKMKLDEQSLKRLQSLGYVGGTTVQNFDFDQSKDDPKDLIGFHNSFHKVIRLMFEEKYDEAKSICQKLILQRPEFYETWSFMATISIRQNDLVGAVPYLYKMLELEPGEYRTNYTLGLALTKMGKLEEATKYYKKALELNPKSFEVHNELGLTLYQKGKLKEAIDQYTKALEIEPQSPKVHENIAKALVQQGKLDQAIDHFNKTLQFAPAQADTHYELAAVLMKLNRTDEAIKQLNEFIDSQPANPQLLNKVGALLALWGKPDQAVIYFKNALELDPQMVQAHYSLAQVYLQQHRPDEAVNQYKKLLQIQPENFSIHNQLAGLFYEQKGFNQAAAHLNESLRLKPDQPAMLDNLAKIYSIQGKNQQAMDCWSKALQLRADWPEVLNSLAWLKATEQDESLRNPEKAIQLALRACELTDFKKPELLDTLAVAYAAAGNFDDAVKTAEKAVELAGSLGNDKITDEIKKHLELFKAGKNYR